MATEYHQIDHSIRGQEHRGIVTSDEQFERMKHRRLKLKDRLYQMLQ
ncbi:MAG: YdcH family protein [Marinobacterium sp.]|nr:YdcH family protein [Marinobacterium sp.]